jgi:restriction system protein
MKRYCRVFLGKAHSFAEECRQRNFVGVDFDFDQDLSGKFPEDWRDFNKEFVPILMNSGYKSKISAGLACGMTWTLCSGLNIGDVVLCPSGHNTYFVGTISSAYLYAENGNLPHRREVKWMDLEISPSQMSEELLRSARSIGTTSMLDPYAAEIEQLVNGLPTTGPEQTPLGHEVVSEGVLEKHLEEFLVRNWDKTPFFGDYEIYKDTEGQTVGQQFNAFGYDRIDILAQSKDKRTLLVVELKKGKGTDETVGQLLRYMGYMNTIKEEGQVVRGMIIAHEANEQIQHALSMVQNVEFYAYKLHFSLTKLL